MCIIREMYRFFLYIYGKAFSFIWEEFFFKRDYGSRFLKHCEKLNVSFSCKLIYIYNLCEIVSI